MVKKETVKTDTESRILQAAEEEFLLKGLEGARTTAIAERAGVTHAMLHYYFRTKNMLFERIIEEKMRNAGNIMQAVFVLGDMPLMERVKRGVEQHFDFTTRIISFLFLISLQPIRTCHVSSFRRFIHIRSVMKLCGRKS